MPNMTASPTAVPPRTAWLYGCCIRMPSFILGIGVGLDRSPFYQRCLAAELTQGLDNQLFADTCRLLGSRRPSGWRQRQVAGLAPA